MQLSRKRAEQLAFEYVNKEKNENFSLELISVEVSKISAQYWAATFEVKNSEGHIIEGPLLILVDDELGKAMSLDEAIEAHLANKDK